jgi:peroxiredoxin Q/BCP
MMARYIPWNVARAAAVGLLATLFWLNSIHADTAAAGASETPKAGQIAPPFEGVDQDGTHWKLADLSGKKIVLLYFYPKDGTPGCTAEACGLRDRMSQLSADDVQVLGVSFDSAESHKKFRASNELNFPLLVDTDGKLADLYCARKAPEATVARRVSFLIAKDGKITHITDTNPASVHLSEMQEAIAKMKTK